MHKIKIAQVQEDSIAAELGIQPGDSLLSINGAPVRDVFDYRFLCADSELNLAVEKADGEIWEIDISKDEMEDLGLEFSNSLLDEEKSCRNKCVFCFIDQLPKGMRETLYFKDDDARLSFLFGNYITMTNMSDDEINRIIRYRMSPVNISVHTTNPELRIKMLNNRFAGDILDRVKRFTENGITVNSQIVLCPGLNDGDELDRTIGDLADLYPELHSISVVPAGLTRYREGLYPLTPFDREKAQRVIDQVEKWQERLLKRFKSRIVYLADELYILAERELPPFDAYEDFPQIENGVGMVSSLVFEVQETLDELAEQQEEGRGKNGAESGSKRLVSIATGVSVYPYIREISKQIEQKIKGIEIKVYPIENEFFGKTITVTGLLTGSDILKGLEGKELGHKLLLSRNMFKAGTDVMLDDISVSELEERLKVEIQIVDNSGQALIDAIVQP